MVHAEQQSIGRRRLSLSMGLGYAYEKSGSLFQSIFMHALFNGEMIAAALLQALTSTGAGPSTGSLRQAQGWQRTFRLRQGYGGQARRAGRRTSAYIECIRVHQWHISAHQWAVCEHQMHVSVQSVHSQISIASLICAKHLQSMNACCNSKKQLAQMETDSMRNALISEAYAK